MSAELINFVAPAAVTEENGKVTHKNADAIWKRFQRAPFEKQQFLLHAANRVLELQDQSQSLQNRNKETVYNALIDFICDSLLKVVDLEGWHKNSPPLPSWYRYDQLLKVYELERNVFVPIEKQLDTTTYYTTHEAKDLISTSTIHEKFVFISIPIYQSYTSTWPKVSFVVDFRLRISHDYTIEKAFLMRNTSKTPICSFQQFLGSKGPTMNFDFSQWEERNNNYYNRINFDYDEGQKEYKCRQIFTGSTFGYKMMRPPRLYLSFDVEHLYRNGTLPRISMMISDVTVSVKDYMTEVIKK